MLKRFAYGAIAIVILLIVVLVFKQIEQQVKLNGGKKVATTFVNEVLAGDATKSHALFTTDTQKQNPIDGTWGDYVSRLGAVFSGEKPTLKSTYPDNGATDVTYTITDTTNVKYTLTVTLVKSSGSWQVTSFTSTQDVE